MPNTAGPSSTYTSVPHKQNFTSTFTSTFQKQNIASFFQKHTITSSEKRQNIITSFQKQNVISSARRQDIESSFPKQNATTSAHKQNLFNKLFCHKSTFNESPSISISCNCGASNNRPIFHRHCGKNCKHCSRREEAGCKQCHLGSSEDSKPYECRGEEFKQHCLSKGHCHSGQSECKEYHPKTECMQSGLHTHPPRPQIETSTHPVLTGCALHLQLSVGQCRPDSGYNDDFCVGVPESRSVSTRRGSTSHISTSSTYGGSGLIDKSKSELFLDANYSGDECFSAQKLVKSSSCQTIRSGSYAEISHQKGEYFLTLCIN